MSPIVVIPTRVSKKNESLRFAIRAWWRVSFDVRIITIGHKYSWYQGEHIDTKQEAGLGKQWSVNFPLALKAACEYLPDQNFIWSADDIFPLSETPPINDLTLWPTWCRPLDLEDYIISWVKRGTPDWYTRSFVEGMIGQLEIIRKMGLTTTYNADCHMPHVLHSTNLQFLMEFISKEFPNHPVGHFRAIYGALHPGESIIRRPDPKSVRSANDTDWLSTSPGTWQTKGDAIRSMFRIPSPYEIT